MDAELLAYIDTRRRQVEEARGTAVHQNGEWAADGALHELDRMQGWLNLRRQRQDVDKLLQEAASGPFIAEAEQ